MIAIKGTAHTFTHTYTQDKLQETLGFVQVKQQPMDSHTHILILSYKHMITDYGHEKADDISAYIRGNSENTEHIKTC